MTPQFSRAALACVLALLVSATGCSVAFPENATFACNVDEHCGGDGYKCAGGTRDRRGICCLPDGAEVCDGRDNDCSGAADDLPDTCYAGPEGTAGVGACTAGHRTCVDGAPSECQGEVHPGLESCNGVDDDCDGATDEDFNLSSDAQNCGACGAACGMSEVCEAGTCVRRGELDCGDGVDNESDGQTDCADNDCEAQACGAGCLCTGGVAAENLCSDEISNDGDADVDCLDADCDGLSCGAGCVCRSGAKAESECNDGISNEGDALIDCADLDCTGASCGEGCVCGGGGRTESNCGDGINNDGDGQVDCSDSDCNGLSCGAGCVCVGGGKSETDCSDGVDNDGLNGTDCADPDCAGALCGPAGSTSTCDAMNACTCNVANSEPMETLCTDGVDNDCFGGADCADLACDGASCGTDCACSNGAKRELNCADRGIDNDNDGRADCSDDVDCPSGTVCQYKQGANWHSGTCQNKQCVK